MALANKSMFLYGFQITENNRSIDFRSVALETPRMATLRLGYYSLGSLADEIERALTEVDASRTFTVSVDRTVSGGIENRVTIASNGTHFELLGSSGTRAATCVLPLLGFTASDFTGATTYTGTASAGTVLIPTYPAFGYMAPSFRKEIFGNVNVSASGIKEAVVYAIQRFWQCEFKYEEYDTIVAEWDGFIDWIIQQRLVEFTPDITDPETFYEGTLEKTESNSKGLGHEMKEMLPQMPGLYRTGAMVFRVSE